MFFKYLQIRIGLILVIVSLSTSAIADHSWNNYHWARIANPLPLQVVDSVTPNWDDVLLESLDRWSWQPDVLTMMSISADDAKKTRRRCKMVAGQVRVCNDSYGYNGWLGIATIGLDSSGHIDRGTAKVNDSYASYWQDPAEKNHVMCQEIGHVLGLGHTSEDGSAQYTCMDYSSDIGSQWPNQHDYDQLVAIYTHLDSYNSYGDGSGGDSGVCNAPAGKGCNKYGADGPPMGVRVHRGHGYEVWVANRADGGLWIHRIRLAPGKP